MVLDGGERFRRASDLFDQGQRMAAVWHEYRDYQFRDIRWKQLLHHVDVLAWSSLLRPGQEKSDGSDVGCGLADNRGDRLLNDLVFAIAIALSLLPGP